MKSPDKPMGFFEAVVGGRAVGAPGVIAMLWQAHRAHGRLAWRDLFTPAIKLARNGFAVSERLNRLIRWKAQRLKHPSVRDYFLIPDKNARNIYVPLPVGHILKNPAYAKTLARIAELGPDGFYKGDVARAMVEAVRSHDNPGKLSLEDLARYKPRRRAAICLPYRTYRLCGMPPSTSGGVGVLQIMKLLEPFTLSRMRPGSLTAVHLISEASKLAFADRNLYLADPDHVDVPVSGLIDPVYLKRRARQIHPGRAANQVKPGRPLGYKPTRFAQSSSPERPSTSHFTIADSLGHVVSMTSSVEHAFGAHIMAAGFILNNQLTDFSFRPVRDGRPVANAVAGNKRPRSSMSPVMVFDDRGRLYAALGSPGGSRIIGYVAQTLIALIDWRLDMQAAIDLPRHIARTGPIELEAGTRLARLAGPLRAMGHKVFIRPLTSGLHGIRFEKTRLEGGADPRREGVLAGGVIGP
jgi:gamma-glutamyltranspeptidase/glutathione hydrolase